MSKVMRWKLKGFIPGVEGVSEALFQPWVVRAEDFDLLASECGTLQQRLIVTEQRADVLEGLLHSMTCAYKQALTAGHDRITDLGGSSACDGVERMLADNPDYARALSALKPATVGESHESK